MCEQAKARLVSGTKAEGNGRPYGVVDLREHLLLLLIYYRAYTSHLLLTQIFHMDEATICRAIRRIVPLAERFLQIKPERLLSENDL